ncbi:MAG: hypothetical protein ACOYCD_07530 [Kiritimatiellia bacterium]|jgi:hypothetical protein
MKITISFATEEFVTPEHDDVILRLATILRQRGITGSFHLTGDYARKLRERRRSDVITALREHEIGYHGNTHGALPFLIGICEERSWEDAVAALMATEARGIMDIADIFDRKPMYYVLEFVKAPQLIYALKGLGIDLLGFSGVPSSDNAPFSWYCGSLCFSAPHMGLETPWAPGRLQAFQKEFESLYAQAAAGAYDGVVKLFNHPYKFLYNNNIESWVSANQLYRRSDIHLPWQIPRAGVYGREITGKLFADFEQFLDYVQGKPDVEFLSTSALMKQYRRMPPKHISLEEVAQLTAAAAGDLNYQLSGGVYYSSAEIFGLLVYVLDAYAGGQALPDAAPYRDLLGPVEITPPVPNAVLTAPEILNAARRVNRELDFYRRLPTVIDVGGVKLPPGSFLAAGTALLSQAMQSPTLLGWTWRASTEALQMPRMAAHPYFAETTFTKASYPEGFTGRAVCAACRRQSWTYKPAVSITSGK